LPRELLCEKLHSHGDAVPGAGNPASGGAFLLQTSRNVLHNKNRKQIIHSVLLKTDEHFILHKLIMVPYFPFSVFPDTLGTEEGTKFAERRSVQQEMRKSQKAHYA
jgi:hypothetical protein